jgi:hypothetical protein
MNDAVKEPVTVVVTGEVDALISVSIVMVELAANPFPDTVTDVPFEPLVGATVRDGVTFNVAFAELPPLSVTVRI